MDNSLATCRLGVNFSLPSSHMGVPSTGSHSQQPTIQHASETSPVHPRRPIPGVIHLAVVTAFIIPITLFPYILARRQLSVLKHQLAETRTSLRVLHQELNLTWREVVSNKEQVQQLQGSLQQIKRDNDESNALNERKEVERTKLENEIKSDLQRLLKEARTSRAQAILLRALGASLADVAAFMHEVDLEMGLVATNNADQRGIERLRLLAMQMEKNPDLKVSEQSGTDMNVDRPKSAASTMDSQ